MKRTLITALLALFLFAVPALQAQSQAAAEPLRDAVTAEIENLFQDLLGLQDVPVVFQDHGAGLYSLTAQLPADLEPPVEKSADGFEQKAKPVLVMAAGISSSTPSNPSSLINKVYTYARLEYNYWWVVSNSGKTDVNLKTTAKLIGPGKKFNKVFNLDYPKKTVKLYYYDPKLSVDKQGIYTFKVTVPKAGVATTRTYGRLK